MECKIEGLTAKQKRIADVLWSLDTMESVENFILSLPKKDMIDAHGILSLITYELLEDDVAEKEKTGFKEVLRLINKLK